MSKVALPLALLASVIVVGATASPAMAKPAESLRTLPVTVKEQKGQTVYCVRETITGSLIPENVCRTRAQWIETGATFRTTARYAMTADKASSVRQD